SAASLRDINPAFSHDYLREFGAVQINNLGEVVAVDTISEIQPAESYVRLWDASTGSFQVLDRAGGAGEPYVSIFPRAAINNAGSVAFAAYDGTVVSVNRDTGQVVAEFPSPQPLLNPAIDDQGDVVLRDGSPDQPSSTEHAAAPIKMFAPKGSSTVIADPAD